MRRHGWQPPYHPLQVVAIAIFLALAFAFYVFFAPFLGKKLVEYVVVGLYTPLVANVFFLYVWCAAKDPVDDGVLKSKKYFSIIDPNRKDKYPEESTVGGSISFLNKVNTTTTRDNELDRCAQKGNSSNELETVNTSFCNMHVCLVLFSWWPVSLVWNCGCACNEYSEKQSTEGGVFYCRLCETEVCKYSKHCRVCDKCVDGFDHHCRWLNTCIGRKNYWRFFVLMISALLLLFLQFSIGVVVLVDCFLERKRLNVEIASKLGSSFSFLPFVIVIAFCTIMAMVATLPLVQLFFFHVLLIQKGISTYDYIIALREQKPEVGGRQQSQQNSPMSSHTGLSNASSSNTFNRAAWCTPPRLFLEDEFDIVPPENGTNRRMGLDGKNKSTGAIKISPWTLRRMKAEEVSNTSAQARRKSQILQPAVRRKTTWKRETGSSFDGRSGRVASRFESRRQNKRARLPGGIPATKFSGHAADRNSIELESGTPMDLDRLWLELTSASWINRATSSAGIFPSDDDSSPCSSELQPFHASFFGADESRGPATTTSASPDKDKGIMLSRSTSDGYEASGGEDSDRVPTRFMHRSSNWCNLVLNSIHDDKSDVEVATYAAGLQEDRV